MAEKSCGTCGRCVPIEGEVGDAIHAAYGECTLISSLVSRTQTGKNCKQWRDPNAETLRVRIGVRVEGDGSWHAAGADGWPEHDILDEIMDYNGHPPETVLIHWLEADLPIPVSQTVEGEVVA